MLFHFFGFLIAQKNKWDVSKLLQNYNKSITA